MYGGAAPNPFVSIAQIIAKLKDENGHISSRFYDDVVPPSAEELAAWRSLLSTKRSTQDRSRLKTVSRRARYSVLERTWARPTLDVTEFRRFHRRGRQDRYPRKAQAKVSMRLVPNMTPPKPLRSTKLRGKDRSIGVDIEVRLIHSGDACLIRSTILTFRPRPMPA